MNNCKCAICGTEFYQKASTKKHRASRYCSKECYGKARQKFTTIQCAYCEEDFEVSVGEVGYIKICSDECAHKYNEEVNQGLRRARSKNRWLKVNCIECSKEYWKWGEKGTKYCSRTCKVKATEEKNAIKLNCLECNKEFKAIKTRVEKHGAKFCSVSCASRYNSRKQGFGINIKPSEVWNKGLTAKTDVRVAKMSIKARKTFAKHLASGKITINHRFYGKGGYREDLGHIVRSRWEANFARIMLYLNRKYIYEPQRFVFKDGHTYLPDFYDAKYDRYIEIKGFWTKKSKMKINQFQKEYPHIKLWIIEPKEYYKLRNYFKDKVEWEE